APRTPPPRVGTARVSPRGPPPRSTIPQARPLPCDALAEHDTPEPGRWRRRASLHQSAPSAATHRLRAALAPPPLGRTPTAQQVHFPMPVAAAPTGIARSLLAPLPGALALDRLADLGVVSSPQRLPQLDLPPEPTGSVA